MLLYHTIHPHPTYAYEVLSSTRIIRVVDIRVLVMPQAAVVGDAPGRDLFGTGTYWRPMLLPARNSNSYSFAYIPPGFRVVLAIIDPAI